MQAEAEPFLQRIRAFPDDDAPRLIFADWLDEQDALLAHPGGRGVGVPGAGWGAARSTFIRVQIAIARLEEETRVARTRLEDTGAGEGIARAERESARLTQQRREHELLELHRAEWEAPFQGLATGLQFHRGFIEKANVGARELLRHAQELFAAGPLRHLHLLDVGDYLPAVLQCPFLSRLTALTIRAQYAGEPLARAVARSECLSDLTVLQLIKNRFEDDSAEHLAGSPNLGRLQELDLAENELGETGARALAASSHLGTVRNLELRKNKLGPAGAEALAGSERLTALHRLGLAENEIGVARLHTLSRAHDLLRVPVLDLSSNGLGVAALQVILTRPPGFVETSPVRLRELDLSHNALGDAGIRVLASCSHLEGVRVLRLAGCAIGDDGARALARSPHLNRLVELDLSNNPIGDPGFQAFLDTPHFRVLRRLRKPGVGVSIEMDRKINARFHL